MSTATISWKEKQKECNLADTDLTARVKGRIKKWEKRTRELQEIETGLNEANQEIQSLAPNTHAFKRMQKDIDAMQVGLQATQQEVDELNEQLCSEMQRLVDNADSIAKSRERLLKIKNEKPTTIPAESAQDDSGESTTTIPAVVMNPAAAGIENAATIPLMITSAMRQELYNLKYSESQVDKMKPSEAHAILTAPKANEAEQQAPENQQTVAAAVSDAGTTGTSTTTAGASTVASTSQAAGAGTFNAPTIPAKKVQPVAAKNTATPNQKTNKVMAGIGIAFAFIGGILFGKSIK